MLQKSYETTASVEFSLESWRAVWIDWYGSKRSYGAVELYGVIVYDTTWYDESFRPFRLHAVCRCDPMLYTCPRSVVSVSVSVRPAGEMCKNGRTDRDAVWDRVVWAQKNLKSNGVFWLVL